jgi:multidrug efflux pump subunit AcrA (membrane-fusion protein)
MQQNINNAILNEIAALKQQLEAAQLRLAALESLLQQAQQAQAQQQVQEQAQVEVQKPVEKAKEVKSQPKSKPDPAPKRPKEEEFEFHGDISLALSIMKLVEERGDLRVSTLKWYLSLNYDIRVSEREIVETIKSLERLEALKGTWAMPGPMGSRIPVRDPWADRGPEFIPVLRKLESLRNKWR